MTRSEAHTVNSPHINLREDSPRGGSVLFSLVCLYWLSQAFLVPLAPVGPSWALWPAFSDVVILAMVPFVLRPSPTATPEIQTVLNSSWCLFWLCLASFLTATALYGRQGYGVAIGAYQIYRFLQCLVVTLGVARLTLDQSRRALFARVALSTFCLVAAGVLLTASGLVSYSSVTPFLPSSLLVAGPWGFYVSGATDQSCGFISYNHGYTGIQLILSGGAAYLCFERSRRIRLLICCLLLICTFVSGSRAGFLASLLLVVALEWKRASSNLFALLLLCALGGLWAITSLSTADMVERQSSSVSSMDDDGLSGRTDIWQEHLDYFTAHPLNLLFGTGYGYASKASTSNAHMLYLHVLTETGLVGLLIFLRLLGRTLTLLRPPRLRTMRLIVWVLLVTALTQETFYPTPAFTQFLAFYLAALVMALRFTEDPIILPVTPTCDVCRAAQRSCQATS